MTTLLVRGGSDVHGAPLDLAISDGVVVDDADGPVLDATGLTVLPGLIDLQVNGCAGIDVTAEPTRLWEVGVALTTYGVTAFVPTVITSAPAARDEALRTWAAGPPPDWEGAEPLGLHFEGPFLSPARRGAHPEQWLTSPDLELVAGWSRTAGVVMVTIAPELPRALDVIEALAARGVLVSVGHTDATAGEVQAAVAAGARCLTHLGNAMPPLRSREPGPVGTALGGAGLVAGVIADGHHHDPLFLSTVWRALGPGRFLSVSDTTAALGLPDGPVRLGDQQAVVRDGTIRLADGTLAGSAASLPACLRTLQRTTGASLADVVATATTTPAGLLDDPQRGHVRRGARGDVTLVDADLTVAATVVGGRVVHRRARWK
jgi:N-acetylglucosamine-6-phosphate deacetylase